VIARGPDDKAPRWFTAMDANQDGVISRREFLAGGKVCGAGQGWQWLLEVGELVTKIDGK